MHELIGLTTATDGESTHSIAATASRELERFAHKGKSPYWDITAASYDPETTQASLATAASGSAETTSSDASVGDDEDGALIVHELGTPDADTLLENAFAEMREETASKLERMHAAVQTAIDEPGEEPVTLKQVSETDAVIAELLDDGDFVYSAAEIGDRFGSVYRVFDLTGWRHGYPVRSPENIQEIKDHYDNGTQTVYVVKLLARKK